MNDKAADSARPVGVKLLDNDRVQVEFLIEDLVKQLAQARISPIASCNGCNSCSAVTARVNPAEKR